MKTYFQFPNGNGAVYEVDRSPSTLREGCIVVLPNAGGTMVSLQVEKGKYPVAVPATLAAGKNALLHARRVIRKGGFQVRLCKRRSWNQITPMLIAAASVNALFSVRLTKKEYTRLLNGGLQGMLYRFPESVRPLLSLRKNYLGEGTYSLELFRHCGSCCR